MRRARTPRGRRMPPPSRSPPRRLERGQDPRGRDLVLEPAVQAVARVERVADQRQVADLAGGAMRAAHQLVVDDHAHPDPGADPDVDDGRDSPGEPEPLLADRGEVDVVVDQHRQVEALADHLERVKAALRGDVVGQRRDPAADCGRSHPGAEIPSASGRPWEPPAWSITSLIISSTCTPDRAAAVLGGRPLQIADRLAEQVRGGDPHVGAADVSAEHEPGAVGHDVGDGLAAAGPGRLPAARTSPACSSRETAAETVGLESAGGRRDLRSGDRPLAEDRLEHRLLAELAQHAQPRVRRARGPDPRPDPVTAFWHSR